MKIRIQFLVCSIIATAVLVNCSGKTQSAELPTIATSTLTLITATPFAPIPTSTRTSDITLPDFFRQLPPSSQKNIFSLRDYLSPDGRWLLVYEYSDQPIRIISTYNPNVYFEEEIDTSIDNIVNFVWSPDCTSVIAIAQTHVAPFAIDHLIVYKIIDATYLVRTEYWLDHPSGWDVLWSPDNSTILVRPFDQNKLLFINPNTQDVLNTFELGQGNETRFDGIWWASDGVYFITRGVRYESGDLIIWPDQLQRLNPSTLQIESLPIRMGRPVAFSPKADKVMTAIENDDANILFVWNLISFKLEKTIVLNNDFGVFYTLDAPVVVVSNNNNLYLYDWEYRTFKNYGAVERIIGWRSAFRGVLVVKESPELETPEYFIELIKP